jgi:hypothetical protein
MTDEERASIIQALIFHTGEPTSIFEKMPDEQLERMYLDRTGVVGWTE